MRNASIQLSARQLSQENISEGLFSVEVMFWDDLLALYDRHFTIINQHYGTKFLTTKTETNILKTSEVNCRNQLLTRVEIVDFGCWATLGGYLAEHIGQFPELDIWAKALKHFNHVIPKLNVEGINPLSKDSINQMQNMSIKVSMHLNKFYSELSEWYDIASIISFHFISQTVTDMNKLSQEEARQIGPQFLQNTFKQKLIDVGIPIDQVRGAVDELSKIKRSHGYKLTWNAFRDTLDFVRSLAIRLDKKLI